VKRILIAPSILSANFGKLNEEIASVDRCADLIHCDVMDGCFVPNITFGNEVIKCIKSSKPLDIHLMIANPEKHIGTFASCNEKISMVSFHLEATKKPAKIIKLVKDRGIRAGIAIKPKTPLTRIFPFLSELDFVLIMTVEPGFGGQKFIQSTLPKVEKLRKLAPDLDIEVDGGINAETAKLAVKAGANILVSGSYIFGARNRKKVMEEMRKIAQK
jgi:ribulose-phosphate 3-epimerase